MHEIADALDAAWPGLPWAPMPHVARPHLTAALPVADLVLVVLGAPMFGSVTVGLAPRSTPTDIHLDHLCMGADTAGRPRCLNLLWARLVPLEDLPATLARVRETLTRLAWGAPGLEVEC